MNTVLSKVQRYRIETMLANLPTELTFHRKAPRKKFAHCPDAGYAPSTNESVNLYRQFLLLRDDLRYHVNYNGKVPTNLTEYVHAHYHQLVQRVKDLYLANNVPNWKLIEPIEKAGIDVVWNKEHGQLIFFIEGKTLVI